MSPSGQEVQTIAGTWVWAGDDCDAARGAEFTAPRRGRSGERTDIPSLVRAKGWRYQEWPDALDKAKFDLFVDNIKPDRTPEDLLFQVMLDWGVDLALPISQQIIAGKAAAIDHAARIVVELRAALDPSQHAELCANLDALYQFVDEQLTAANCTMAVPPQHVPNAGRYLPKRPPSPPKTAPILAGFNRDAARRLRSLLGAYEQKRDLIALGAYARGADPLVDQAIADGADHIVVGRPIWQAKDPAAAHLRRRLFHKGRFDALHKGTHVA